VRSDLESNPGAEGDLHDGGGSDGRRVGGCGTKSRGERLGRTSGSGFRGVDGNSWKLGNGRESGGVEGGEGHRRHGGDASSSRLMSRWWREACGGKGESCAIQDRAGPARRASGLPTFFSDGAKSGDVDVTIVVNGHLCELLSKRDHCGQRFRERGAGQEDLPSSLEESQLINLGETGEEEGQTRADGRRDELDGDKGVGRKSDDQGGFDCGKIDPEAVDLHEFIGGRHYEDSRNKKGLKMGRVVSWLQEQATGVRGR